MHKDTTEKSMREPKNDTKITVLDIERENRLAKVISLFSKGLSQEEIALELHVDQSTVSRDLQLVKQEARRQVEKYLREDILLEYVRYMAGSNEITRELWEIVQHENATTKDKINALSQLMQLYNSRLQTLTNGPESYMNIKKSLSEIELKRLVDSEPFLKAQMEQRKLFPKGLFNFKSRHDLLFLFRPGSSSVLLFLRLWESLLLLGI